jgi:hypothetical protein
LLHLANSQFKMADLKIYALLEHLNPTAPIYIRVSKDKRVRIDKIPQHQPYLRITVSDKEGNNKVLRLKLNSNTIDQSEQVKAGIPANEPFTMAERNAVKFRNGILATNRPIVQKFLEAHAEMEGFDGLSDSVKQPMYKLLDKAAEVKATNAAFKKSLKAANLIAEMDVKTGQETLIRVYGTHYVPPAKLDEIQNALVEYMESSDSALDEILKGEELITVDEEIKVILGKLLAAKEISYDAVPDQISKNKNGNWVPLKFISSKDYDTAQRERMFMEFLQTRQGSLVLADLSSMADNLEGDNEENKGADSKKEEALQT